MPRDAFALKIQRELCHPKCAQKGLGSSRNGPLVPHVPCALVVDCNNCVYEGSLFKFHTHFAVGLLCWLPSMHGMTLEKKPKEIQALAFQRMDRAIHCITRYSLDNSRRFGLRSACIEAVTGHLATRESRHQPSRHQGTTSPPTTRVK